MALHRLRFQLRFIPARAGNGPELQAAFYVINGSSPRVRGTGLPIRGRVRSLRFIPARAGNGFIRANEDSTTAVHPRACGERFSASTLGLSAYGSSPRVRGTDPLLSPASVLMRFIPARAGNGGPNPNASSPIAVHPRACGERWPRHQGSWLHGGSSPRVRGTGVAPFWEHVQQRFIPARAGNG